MIRVGVLGASGRMGSETCSAIDGADDLDLVARVDRTDPLQRLIDERVEVAVDFTVPNAVKDNVLFCVGNGIHAVVGTTGLDDDDVEEIRARAREGGANAVVAPNFSYGAVLMMAFARQAARHFEWVEIVERHHEGKVDAPSGTALRTAQVVREARDADLASAPGRESSAGARGADVGGVRVHSLRLPGSVAHQEVIFGARGETLTIRHDSVDRASFMPGVLLAVRRVSTLPGVTVGLEHLLE